MGAENCVNWKVLSARPNSPSNTTVNGFYVSKKCRSTFWGGFKIYKWWVGKLARCQHGMFLPVSRKNGAFVYACLRMCWFAVNAVLSQKLAADLEWILETAWSCRSCWMKIAASNSFTRLFKIANAMCFTGTQTYAPNNSYVRRNFFQLFGASKFVLWKELFTIYDREPSKSVAETT